MYTVAATSPRSAVMRLAHRAMVKSKRGMLKRFFAIVLLAAHAGSAGAGGINDARPAREKRWWCVMHMCDRVPLGFGGLVLC